MTILEKIKLIVSRARALNKFSNVVYTIRRDTVEIIYIYLNEPLRYQDELMLNSVEVIERRYIGDTGMLEIRTFENIDKIIPG